MCDYCNCRTVVLLDELGAEHDHLRDLGGRVRRALAAGHGAEASAALVRLARLLHRHTEVEEASVLAALRADGAFDLEVDALLADHDHARRILADAEDGPPASDGVLAFLDDLDAHIAREEYDVFPAAAGALSPLAWDDAERAAEEARARV